MKTTNRARLHAFVMRKKCRKQAEINRLRKVLNEIADSAPHAYMDIENDPELVSWICDTCRKARIGAYPSA